MTTLGVCALAVEIRDIIAQSVGLGNVAMLGHILCNKPALPPFLSKSTACLVTANAEACDPTYYTAVIWPEHDRWSGHGTVQTLKTAEVDGKLKLFAILCPNRALIYYNQSGQYRFCSIKPFENFADTGRTYLLGLGITDEPNPRIRK